jgi:hypothetical protein
VREHGLLVASKRLPRCRSPGSRRSSLSQVRAALLTAQKSASLHDAMLNLSAFLKAFSNNSAFSRDKTQGPRFASNLRAHARPKAD